MSNAKQRMMTALNGGIADCQPVTPHWWGLYKFAHMGMITDYDGSDLAWGLSGKEVAQADSRFFQDFSPDWFHLTTGCAKKNKAPIFSDQAVGEQQRLFEAVRELDSYSAIDEYIAVISNTKEQVLESGEFDHVKILSGQYGNQALLMVNEGNPISNILDPHGCVGFMEGLIALLEKPDLMEYLVEKSYQAILPRMEALKELGADGYIGSETYCSADIMAPDLWRGMIYPAQKRFYTKLRSMGMIPVSYFLGDIEPLLDDLKEMGIMGLMVEEGKKNFTLEIGSIYDRLEQQVCLFGNLDSVYTLQNGTVEDVKRETLRQINRCNKGGFVMSNGCPLSFGTPAENIHAMLDTARGR